MKITGKATITLDGEILAAENQASLNPGGVNRNPESHGGHTYYSEEDTPPELSMTVLITKDTDLIRLSNIVGATVTFKADTGQTYILRDAFTTAPVPHEGSGKAQMTMSARAVDQV